jgi:ferredoxin/flavodoxin---NADP+ reductase
VIAEQKKEQPRPTVAIIGSGPSGCYTAQFLRKELPDAEITIFEALPVPYGLVRYGVAADHQGTKAVAAQFDRMFDRGNITFVGNTRIGVDIAFETITDSFDIVVIATGLPHDRQLSIPQDDGARIVGAGRILRALNAFPEEAAIGQDPLHGGLGDDLVVVGHGNVAIDVVRLLTKPAHHLSGSDIHDHSLDLLRPNPPRSLRIIGRSPADNAKWDLAMLRELCTLDSLRIHVHGLGESTQGSVADLLRETVRATDAATDTAGKTAVTFHFQTTPAAVRLENGRTILDVTNANGETTSFSADTVITAIGFCEDDDSGDDAPAWSDTHVFRVGWLERGGRGNIAENRKHAQMIAKSIAADVKSGHLPHGRGGGLTTVLSQLHASTVDFAGWQAIDEAERAAADEHRCRRKITDLGEMVDIALAGRTSDTDG